MKGRSLPEECGCKRDPKVEIPPVQAPCKEVDVSARHLYS